MTGAAGRHVSTCLPPRVQTPTAFWTRHRAPMFFGAQKDDDDIIRTFAAAVSQQLKQKAGDIFNLRAEAEAAVASCDSHAFVDVAHRALLWMHQQDPRHPFYWPRKSGVCQWRDPAPAAFALDTALRNVFGCVAARSEGNNAAGLALAGARGVGKSQVLRALVCVTGLLLPARVVSAYVDYKAVPALYTPGEILLAALRAAPPAAVRSTPLPSILQQGLEATLAGPPSLGAAFGAAGLQGRAILFAADEVSHVYLNPAVWGELHALANDTVSCTLVADSSSLLPDMVKRSNVEALQHRFGVERARDLPQSLNDDKLRLCHIPPLQSLRAYRDYLQQRDDNDAASSSADSEHGGDAAAAQYGHDAAASAAKYDDGAIRSLHLRTGGRARAIDHALAQVQASVLPAHGSPAHHVLQKLTELQQRSSKPFDVFDTVSVEPQQVEQWLHDWHSSRARHAGRRVAAHATPQADLYSLQDDSIIVPHPARPGEYTFATPAHYFHMGGQ